MSDRVEAAICAVNGKSRLVSTFPFPLPKNNRHLCFFLLPWQNLASWEIKVVLSVAAVGCSVRKKSLGAGIAPSTATHAPAIDQTLSLSSTRKVFGSRTERALVDHPSRIAQPVCQRAVWTLHMLSTSQELLAARCRARRHPWSCIA